MKLIPGKIRFGLPRRGVGRLQFAGTRLVLCLVMVAFTAGSLTTAAQSMGVIGHHNIVEGAVSRLDKPAYSELVSILTTYYGQRRYGANFPDWGSAWSVWYWWMSDAEKVRHRDYSEIAHWPDFEAAFLRALIPTLETPYSDEDKKAIAFYFGMIAHNEADFAYHWLFLKAALENGDPGTFGNHWDIETGSETIIRDALEGGFFGDYCDAWDLPAKAKTAIYAAYSALGAGTVNEAELLDGYNVLGWLCKDEKLWASRSDIPWTTANLQDYPEGGVDDLYNHVATAWQHDWDLLQANAVGANVYYGHTIFMPMIEQ